MEAFIATAGSSFFAYKCVRQHVPEIVSRSVPSHEIEESLFIVICADRKPDPIHLLVLLALNTVCYLYM